MELRPLGSTGLLASALGLGTVKIGRNTGVKYPGGDGFALPSDDQVADLLRAAAKEQINVIDTAPAYGSSEERLGAIMHAHNWFSEVGGGPTGGRDRWVIVTKTGEEFEAGRSRFDFTPEHTRRSVERSLQRLGCDVLDCVLIHSDGRDEQIIEELGTLEALHDLADRGLLRAYGISTKTPAGAMRAAERLASDRTAGRGVLMATLNPRSTADLPAIRAAADRGVGVLIKKALDSGHLQWRRPPAGEGEPQLPAPPPGESPHPPAAPHETPSALDPVETNLRFIFHEGGPALSSVIVGTTSPEHLRANAAAARRALRA